MSDRELELSAGARSRAELLALGYRNPVGEPHEMFTTMATWFCSFGFDTSDEYWAPPGTNEVGVERSIAGHARYWMQPPLQDRITEELPHEEGAAPEEAMQVNYYFLCVNYFLCVKGDHIQHGGYLYEDRAMRSEEVKKIWSEYKGGDLIIEVTDWSVPGTLSQAEFENIKAGRGHQTWVPKPLTYGDLNAGEAFSGPDKTVWVKGLGSRAQRVCDGIVTNLDRQMLVRRTKVQLPHTEEE